MIIKILKVFGEKNYQAEDLGLAWDHRLYPAGTKRIAIAYTLFPKTLDGEKRRGVQIIEQSAAIECSAGVDGTATYNSWRDLRFLDFSKLERAALSA